MTNEYTVNVRDLKPTEAAGLAQLWNPEGKFLWGMDWDSHLSSALGLLSSSDTRFVGAIRQDSGELILAIQKIHIQGKLQYIYHLPHEGQFDQNPEANGLRLSQLLPIVTNSQLKLPTRPNVLRIPRRRENIPSQMHRTVFDALYSCGLHMKSQRFFENIPDDEIDSAVPGTVSEDLWG